MHAHATTMDTIHHQLVSITDTRVHVLLRGAVRQYIDMTAPPMERASYLQTLFGDPRYGDRSERQSIPDVSPSGARSESL